MKNYDVGIYRQHIKEIPNCRDPYNMQCYLRGVVDIANGFVTREQTSGILDKNDMVQECYLALIKTWDNINWDAIHATPKQEHQAQVWAFIKKTVKLNARHGINNIKDSIRIPRYKRWELNETKNVDDFLTQLFPREFFEDNAMELGLSYEETLIRYDIEQLGIGLDDVMTKWLSHKEQIIIECYFGVDREKLPVKKIANLLNISESNVKKTKFVALDKLKNEEVKDYLKEFYTFE